MRRILPLLAIAALAGCGGGGDGGRAGTAATPVPDPAPSTTTPRAPAARVKPASAADTRVIRAWAGAVARGDIAGATRLFALPSLLQIDPGGATLVARNRAILRGFNATLPCGARLVQATRRGPYADATFRLVNRAGSRCDSPGATARTAFRIRDGRITEWRRLPDTGAPPSAPAASGSDAV